LARQHAKAALAGTPDGAGQLADEPAERNGFRARLIVNPGVDGRQWKRLAQPLLAL
jgi:hypothetical protein